MCTHKMTQLLPPRTPTVPVLWGPTLSMVPREHAGTVVWSLSVYLLIDGGHMGCGWRTEQEPDLELGKNRLYIRTCIGRRPSLLNQTLTRHRAIQIQLIFIIPASRLKYKLASNTILTAPTSQQPGMGRECKCIADVRSA